VGIWLINHYRWQNRKPDDHSRPDSPLDDYSGGATGELAESTIAEYNIVANTITAASIAATTITAAQIVADTITANEIAANTITAAEITAGDNFRN